MPAESSLFDRLDAAQSAFRWSEPKSGYVLRAGEAGGGAVARIWRSAVTGKLVLTVEVDGMATTRHVAEIEPAMELAETWLVEMTADRGRTRK